MEMHPILSTYRVGNITLKIVELEVQRAQHRYGSCWSSPDAP